MEGKEGNTPFAFYFSWRIGREKEGEEGRRTCLNVASHVNYKLPTYITTPCMCVVAAVNLSSLLEW